MTTRPSDAASEPCPYCNGAGCLPCRGRGTVGPRFRSNRPSDAASRSCCHDERAHYHGTRYVPARAALAADLAPVAEGVCPDSAPSASADAAWEAMLDDIREEIVPRMSGADAIYIVGVHRPAIEAAIRDTAALDVEHQRTMLHIFFGLEHVGGCSGTDHRGNPDALCSKATAWMLSQPSNETTPNGSAQSHKP